MHTTVALIPARSGSKGVPDKNIRELGGVPLVAWSIAACQASEVIQRGIVSTDSQEYAEICRDYGAEVPFLRPMEISGDRSTDYEFIVHALDWLREQGEEPEVVVHIRPTSPLRDPKVIDDAVSAFLANPSATSLRSVHAMSESAYKTFEIAPGGQLKRVCCDNTELDQANNARQEFPDTYFANGYVDVLSTRFIRSSGRIHGDNAIPFITPKIDEIDTERDFQEIERLLALDSKITENLFKRDI